MQVEQNVEAGPTDRLIFGLPVDTSILFFEPKEVRKPRAAKSKTGLLGKVAFLRKFLDADEKILLVTTGCSPCTTLEHLTMKHLWLILVKRALLVFTNKRLLHIPTTTRFNYRGSIAQILYQDCRRLQVEGSGLVVEYHNGTKEKFSQIPGPDRAIIRCFNFVAGESDRPSANPRRNHLCPSCTEVLPSRTTVCPCCGLEFKSRERALTRSVFLPGGGYFYANRPFLGIADALVESCVLVMVLVLLGTGLFGDAEAMATLPVILAVLVMEKLVTIYHTNGFLAEFIPTNVKALLRDQQVQKPPTDLPPFPITPAPERRPEAILSVR
jgi:hypothetical protein